MHHMQNGIYMNSEHADTPPKTIKRRLSSPQVSISSPHTLTHTAITTSNNMLFILVLFVAAVLGTQTIALVAVIYLYKELQQYDERRLIHEEANKANNTVVSGWGN